MVRRGTPARLWLLVGAVLLGLPLLLGAAPGQGREPEAFLTFLFAVYAVTWAAFFGYALFLSRKQQELKREIEELRRALEERGGGPAAPSSRA